MADTPRSDTPRVRPDPDPTALTTDALQREVRVIMDRMDEKFRAEREHTDVKFTYVTDKFNTIERHRLEQKQDTQREITKAFDANTAAIEAVEKTQATDSARITAVEASRQGGTDMRLVIYATVGLLLTVFTVLAANGVFKG